MDNPAFVVELEKERGSNEKVTHSERAHTFEEAITLAQVGRFHYLLLLICGTCFMSVMVEIMGISFIMPFMECDLPSTISEQGLLASSGFLGVVLSSHAMGFLADTWGRVRTLRFALVLSFLATIVSAFSVHIWMLIVFRFLNGFFISGCQACVFSLCGEFHGNRTRVRYVTLLSGFMTIALVYLPSAATGILPLRIENVVFGMPFSSWRILLIVNSSLSLLALAGLMTLPETPKYVLVQGNPEGALEILRYIYQKNTGKPGSEYPVHRIELESGGANLNDIHSFRDALKMIWSQTAPLFHKERYLHTLNICVVVFVIYFVSQGSFMWFPTILNELVAKNGQGLQVCQIIGEMQDVSRRTSNVCRGEHDHFTFQVLIIMGVAFTIFYVFFAFTIDRIGKKQLLVGWMLIAIGCSVAIHWTSNFAVAVIELTLVMAVANCGGIVNTMSIEFFPTNINAMGMCFILMVGRLGAVAGSNVVGQFLFNNCDIVFWAFGALICLIAFLGVFLPERNRKNAAPTPKGLEN